LCNVKPQEEVIKEPVKFEPTMTMFMEIIKDNQEIKNLLIEQNNKVLELHKENNNLINKLVEKDFVTNNNNNTTNNTTTTTNNNKFNLNFFLNETCKDAMNMKEFISNIKITFEELLNIGDTGFVTGVSDIFIKRLRDLDVSKRPIHCTDVKRDTIYLKDEDKWDRDDKENTKLKGFIGNVEYKNLAALHKWSRENPDSKVNDSQLNSLKNKIYLQTLLGDDDTRNKVIKNVSKLVIVDRTGEPV
jgi:spore coat protein CotF